MLYYSGAKTVLSLILKKSTSKRPATIAQLSIRHVDKISILEGDNKLVGTIDLFSGDYHKNHPELAALIDTAVYNGAYSPSVFLAKGFISQVGFNTLAKNIVDQESKDRGITLSDDFDHGAALMGLILQRNYGTAQVLALPAKENTEPKPSLKPRPEDTDK